MAKTGTRIGRERGHAGRASVMHTPHPDVGAPPPARRWPFISQTMRVCIEAFDVQRAGAIGGCMMGEGARTGLNRPADLDADPTWPMRCVDAGTHRELRSASAPPAVQTGVPIGDTAPSSALAPALPCRPLSTMIMTDADPRCRPCTVMIPCTPQTSRRSTSNVPCGAVL
jgi:hypothetical protein